MPRWVGGRANYRWPPPGSNLSRPRPPVAGVPSKPPANSNAAFSSTVQRGIKEDRSSPPEAAMPTSTHHPVPTGAIGRQRWLRVPASARPARTWARAPPASWRLLAAGGRPGGAPSVFAGSPSPREGERAERPWDSAGRQWKSPAPVGPGRQSYAWRPDAKRGEDPWLI
jgi:hypothetical protein